MLLPPRSASSSFLISLRSANLDRIFFPLKEEKETNEGSEETEEFNILDYFVSKEKYYEFKEKYMK